MITGQRFNSTGTGTGTGTGFLLFVNANPLFELIPSTDHTRHASDLKFVHGGSYGEYFFFYQGDFFYFTPKQIYPRFLTIFHPRGSDQKSSKIVDKSALG